MREQFNNIDVYLLLFCSRALSCNHLVGVAVDVKCHLVLASARCFGKLEADVRPPSCTQQLYAMDDDYVFTDADAALAAASAAEAGEAGEQSVGGALPVVEDDRGVIVPQHTLWVGNIPANVNSEQIAAILSREHAHGTVLQVEVCAGVFAR